VEKPVEISADLGTYDPKSMPSSDTRPCDIFAVVSRLIFPERHVGAVIDCLKETSEDHHLRLFFPQILCSACAVLRHFGHYYRSFCLLIYLLNHKARTRLWGVGLTSASEKLNNPRPATPKSVLAAAYVRASFCSHPKTHFQPFLPTSNFLW